MKRFIIALICATTFSIPAVSQSLNNNPDDIIGEYLTDRGGSKSKVRVTKDANGTYSAQVFWVEKPYDANGKKRKDVKNKDKNLRNVDLDKVVISAIEKIYFVVLLSKPIGSYSVKGKYTTKLNFSH